MRLTDPIDHAFAWLKWPSAAAALFFLPGAVLATVDLVRGIADDATPVVTFLGGFALYAVLWWFVFRRWRTSFLSTLEHECTHALFAMMTFHRVTNIKATWSRGGQMGFKGKGNWLITTAPYFVPTVCIFVIAAFWFLPTRLLPWFNPILGVTLAYHVTSTLRETHGGQTDLKKVGRLFSFAFLPTANILTNGLVVAFAYDDGAGMGRFLAEMWGATMRILRLQ